jgi:hypothetical protein
MTAACGVNFAEAKDAVMGRAIGGVELIVSPVRCLSN